MGRGSEAWYEELLDFAFREVVRRALTMSREELTAWAAEQWPLFAPIASVGREGAWNPAERPLRALAVHLAGTFWDRIPRPEEGFRPLVTSPQRGTPFWSGPEPRRNDPCPCGSGRKYKKCCMEVRRGVLQAVDAERLEFLETHATEIGAEYVLEELSNREVLEAAQRGPLWLANAAARELLERHKPKLAAMALEDWVDVAQPMDRGMGRAVDVLLRAYGACGWNRKAQALARQAIEHHPDDDTLIATVAAFLLERMFRNRRGTLKGALEFEKMVPHSPVFRVVGVVARLREARWEDAREAARKTLEVLRFRRDEWLEKYRPMLEETVEDPERAYRHHVLGTNLSRRAYDEVNDFVKWLMGLVWRDHVKPPPGVVVPVGDGEMRFARGSAVGRVMEDRVGGEGEVFRLLELARKDPFDLGVLEALLETLEELGEDTGVLSMMASSMGDRVVPEEVREGAVRLEWSWIENRPYLRLLARRMKFFYDDGKIEDALDDARTLLALDPDDAMGIRGEAVGMALELGDPELALEIVEPYWEEDLLPGTLYGRALALFVLDERAEAAEALDRAIAERPLVARRLLNPDLPEPELGPFGVTLGGEDEAYLYELRWGFLWSEAPRAMEWLRSRYQRFKSGKR